MRPDRFSLRAALMATASPAALWSDITPDAATASIPVDNLSLSGANVCRERSPEMRVADAHKFATVNYADAIDMNRDFRDALAAAEAGTL
jgi:hypothetical protein